MSSDAHSRSEIAFERRRFAVKHALFSLRAKITSNYKPSSYPFVSGDGFRALARLRFDSIEDVEAASNDASFKVGKGDIVFVANSIVKDFFEKVHPDISDPYVLITHNGDDNVNEDYFRFIDSKIIRWFAQNVLVSHLKVTPIPIGLENLHYYQNGIISYFKAMRKKLEKNGSTNNDLERKARIFYHFKVRTNSGERQPAFDYFNRNQLAETIEDKLSPWLYLNKLSRYMFVASPPGNGVDCHRTWEALYLRTIPIVKDSPAMRSFTELGLPLWIVREWSELDGLAEDDLAQKYDILMKTADWEALNMDHWTALTRKAAYSNYNEKEHA